MSDVRFKYVFSKEYNPVYINGAYGGIGPRGELAINFYLERSPVPNEEVRNLLEDGSIGDQVKLEPPNLQETIIRYIDTGVIINYETAKILHKWLGTNIKLMETMKK
jgi:hypothetical protein